MQSGAAHHISIVMGMHRSGTSLLSGLLHQSGITMGHDEIFIPRPNPENPKGFYEHYLFRQINDKILESNGYVVKDWTLDLPRKLELSKEIRKSMISLVTDNLQRYNRWGWKDPRQMLTADLWFQVLKELDLLAKTQVIFEFRHPMSVGTSLLNRGNVSSLAHGMALWHLYNAKALEALKSFPVRTAFMSMESISENPAATLEVLSQFTGMTIGIETYRDFFENDLVRSKRESRIEQQDMQSLYEKLKQSEANSFMSAVAGQE